MADPKEKPVRRTPGPKSKPAIPDTFKISRHLSPMAMILNEAENSDPVQILNRVQNLNPVQKMEPVQVLQETHELTSISPFSPVQNSQGVQNLEEVQILQPVQIAAGSEIEPGSKFEKINQRSAPAKIEPGSKSEPGKGFTPIPNYIIDEIFSMLDPSESILYIRLYRLSYGFGQKTCRVSIPTLANRCNCSENTIRASIKKLSIKGLIRIINIKNTGAKDGGTIFQVFTNIGEASKNNPTSEIEPGANFEPGAIFRPPSKTEPIKDHDHDDLLNKDHHQREVMTIYSSITGNAWSKADDGAYQKIKDYPIEIIKATIRIVTERAAQSPGSLHYFVAEILKAANPTPATKAQQKAAIKQIIKEVRETYTGANLKPSEFAEAVKERCAREGVIFDGRVFNELMG